MPQQIQRGVVTVLTQNVTFAMPAMPCYVTASAAVEISLDNSTWVAQATVTNSAVLVAAPFIRCTTASPNIICKPI